jgi:hypothetical protein
MAPSSALPAVFSLIGCPVTEKLGKDNYPLWSLQVLLAIRGAQLGHYLDSETAAPPPKKIVKDATKPDELPRLQDGGTTAQEDCEGCNEA